MIRRLITTTKVTSIRPKLPIHLKLPGLNLSSLAEKSINFLKNHFIKNIEKIRKEAESKRLKNIQIDKKPKKLEKGSRNLVKNQTSNQKDKETTKETNKKTKEDLQNDKRSAAGVNNPNRSTEEKRKRNVKNDKKTTSSNICSKTSRNPNSSVPNGKNSKKENKSSKISNKENTASPLNDSKLNKVVNNDQNTSKATSNAEKNGEKPSKAIGRTNSTGPSSPVSQNDDKLSKDVNDEKCKAKAKSNSENVKTSKKDDLKNKPVVGNKPIDQCLKSVENGHQTDLKKMKKNLKNDKADCEPAKKNPVNTAKVSDNEVVKKSLLEKPVGGVVQSSDLITKSEDKSKNSNLGMLYELYSINYLSKTLNQNFYTSGSKLKINDGREFQKVDEENRLSGLVEIKDLVHQGMRSSNDGGIDIKFKLILKTSRSPLPSPPSLSSSKVKVDDEGGYLENERKDRDAYKLIKVLVQCKSSSCRINMIRELEGLISTYNHRGHRRHSLNLNNLEDDISFAKSEDQVLEYSNRNNEDNDDEHEDEDEDGSDKEELKDVLGLFISNKGFTEPSLKRVRRSPFPIILINLKFPSKIYDPKNLTNLLRLNKNFVKLKLGQRFITNDTKNHKDSTSSDSHDDDDCRLIKKLLNPSCFVVDSIYCNPIASRLIYPFEFLKAFSLLSSIDTNKYSHHQKNSQTDRSDSTLSSWVLSVSDPN
ncbi:hypothetical protein BY996DRAFT_7769520 [Phakopsora pachyrhizi]|uniref:Expressed protein n=1 Tax=Phakopsora pachyrhizi TaxID=170000 RepID=A0AAV0AVU4_PHAPC|nr:hypothetical protein BY996DRAFT_8110518 [Phakopsora pachyrhizi]KAI8446914.1 hypothetical protein BY996DRAFT_7769520 [Phakopsora pachyrhizi]CAH7672411.1 expressed protein [Phakopsora pachyrhizi]